MSTIQVFPSAAGQTEQNALAQSRLPQDARSDKPQDKDLMYAWSIGVTSAAKEMAEQAPQTADSCPPETYIG